MQDTDMLQVKLHTHIYFNLNFVEPKVLEEQVDN